MRTNPLLSTLLLAAVVSLRCTDTNLEPKSQSLSTVDDRLALQGRVCTAPPDPTGFPVKVLFILDQSGSMCVSDPPGSQSGTGFCEQTAVKAIVPPGVTEPARVRALRTLINQFSAQPNVEIAIVPFETTVKNDWPHSVTGQRFARPFGLDPYITALQNQLGKGTDYQGVLSYAYALIASDISETSANNPALLPRSRYVVVFLTDGTPFPRCTANTNLPPQDYATAQHPELTFPDSPDAVGFCSILDPKSPDNIPGFLPGTDRNQNYQLFSYVDQLMALRQQFNVGDIRMHTVLLFNNAAVTACGALCNGLFGYPANDAETIATYVLRQMAQRGNGVFQEFKDGNVYNLGLGALDYSSLASPNVMKTMILQGMSSVPGAQQREVDSDGDGLPDTLDNGFTNGTNPFVADSDGDCFDDNFEVFHKAEGFDPAKKDSRGCDPASPLSLGCSCRDTDGDGLSQYAETFLKSNAGLMDSDSDGIPDGLEARYGLDPTASNVGLDTDGDGISDLDEIRAGSNPTLRDRGFHDAEGFAYDSVAEVQPNGSICYDFNISNIGLVTPPSRAGQTEGYNLFKVYFAEAPESGVATDYGVWRTACAWAQFAPPSVRVPTGPSLTLQNSDFRDPTELTNDSDYLTKCVGKAP